MLKLVLVATSALVLGACSYSSHGPEDNRSIERMGMVAVGNVDITGDAEFSGMVVSANGTIGRDLDLSGATVNSNATVGGNLSASGARVEFTGSVAGDADIAAALAKLNADFDGDLNVAGARVKIDGVVTGRLFANVAHLNMKGDFLSPVHVVGHDQPSDSKVLISGHIAQGGVICATEVKINSRARLEGELTIYAEERPDTHGNEITFIALENRSCEDIVL